MTTALERQRHWLAQRLARDAPPAGAPDWLAARRAEARAALDRLPPIQRRLEAWRYTDIDDLMKRALGPAAPATAAPALPQAHGPRLVLHDGRYLAAASSLAGLPGGVLAGGLADHARDHPERVRPWLGTLAPPPHLLAALNGALVHDGPFLYLGAGTRLAEPLEIVHHYDGARPCAAHPRGLVVLEAGARATLVERFAGAGAGLHNGVMEIRLGPGATLVHHRLLDEQAPRWQLQGIHVRLDQGAHYEGLLLALGGRWSRSEYYGQWTRPGATCRLDGLYTAGAGRLADVHLDLQHQAPGCTSRARFKGLLYGPGRAVFDGRILVAPQAQGSDARLYNHNLMLAEGAEIDTKPQLEIYADDVQCSHGASIGQIDPLQLFYLRSRGIDAARARQMICRGFAAEVLEGIDDTRLQQSAAAALERALDAALGAAGEGDRP